MSRGGLFRGKRRLGDGYGEVETFKLILGESFDRYLGRIETIEGAVDGGSGDLRGDWTEELRIRGASKWWAARGLTRALSRRG